MQPIFEAGHGFFARFAQTFRSKMKKKMSKYYLLSGFLRIFRKPFINKYIFLKNYLLHKYFRFISVNLNHKKKIINFCTILIYIVYF